MIDPIIKMSSITTKLSPIYVKVLPKQLIYANRHCHTPGVTPHRIYVVGQSPDIKSKVETLIDNLINENY